MNQRKAIGILALTVLAALSWSGSTRSQARKTLYPEMAPAEQYRIANREDEIALARSLFDIQTILKSRAAARNDAHAQAGGLRQALFA